MKPKLKHKLKPPKSKIELCTSAVHFSSYKVTVNHGRLGSQREGTGRRGKKKGDEGKRKKE